MKMETKLLIQGLLGLPKEWEILEINFDEPTKEVRIHVEYTSGVGVCKETGEICRVFDYRTERSWRHMDMLGYHSSLHCRVPRIKNSLGKVTSIPLPWAEDGEQHTKDFENYSIKVLKATHNQSRAGELLGISYDKMNRVMHNGVTRGLERRHLEKDQIPNIHIDEKSYKKGHRYATVISDSKGNRILEVGKDRTKSATEKLLDKTFSKKQLRKMTAVCVDMWDPFMAAVKKSVLTLRSYTTNFTWSVT